MLVLSFAFFLMSYPVLLGYSLILFFNFFILIFLLIQNILHTWGDMYLLHDYNV